MLGISSPQNSVNARESTIPYPWLVFNEKIKVNTVFLRDSTAVSDSVLLLFGGSISKGDAVSFFSSFKNHLLAGVASLHVVVFLLLITFIHA